MERGPEEGESGRSVRLRVLERAAGEEAPEARWSSAECEALREARRALRMIEPRTRAELEGYCRVVLDMRVPRGAPLAYLCHSFLGEGVAAGAGRDCIVWANRGGGKTRLGAVATYLDLMFRPGIQVLILGGSLEQSGRMHQHLRALFTRPEFEDLTAKGITERTIQLRNGSRVDILSQSERSVRGWHVHTLRCDEVDLFEPEVWSAAQFVTKREALNGRMTGGVIEVFSTMHRPFGLMQELVRGSVRQGRRVFRWSLVDVLEKCGEERECEGCGLRAECGGAAKGAGVAGFFSIEDALQQKARSSAQAWQAEMLCRRPSRSHTVYPEFDPEVHVRQEPEGAGEFVSLGGMDFGFRSPTVFLWARYFPGADHLHIVDEHIGSEMRIEEHLACIAGRGHEKPAWVGIDPAGLNQHEHLGTSSAALMRKGGLRVRAARGAVAAGLEAVSARLRAADGRVRLTIDARCVQLIESLTKYHYPESAIRAAAKTADEGSAGGGGERRSGARGALPTNADVIQPVKDGSDHAADALRYLVVNLDGKREGSAMKTYLGRKKRVRERASEERGEEGK